jgi:hypothetical protein
MPGLCLHRPPTLLQRTATSESSAGEARASSGRSWSAYAASGRRVGVVVGFWAIEGQKRPAAGRARGPVFTEVAISLRVVIPVAFREAVVLLAHGRTPCGVVEQCSTRSAVVTGGTGGCRPPVMPGIAFTGSGSDQPSGPHRASGFSHPRVTTRPQSGGRASRCRRTDPAVSRPSGARMSGRRASERQGRSWLPRSAGPRHRRLSIHPAPAWSGAGGVVRRAEDRPRQWSGPRPPQ